MYVRGANVLQRAQIDVPLEVWNNIGVLHLEMGQVLDAAYSLTLALLSCESASLQHASPSICGEEAISGGLKPRDFESFSTVCANLIGVYMRAGCTSAALELACGCSKWNETSDSCMFLTSARLAMKLNDLMTVRCHTSTALPGIHHALVPTYANGTVPPSAALQAHTKTSVFVACSLLSQYGDFHLALGLVQKLHSADCFIESYRAQCYLRFHEAVRGMRSADVSRSLHNSSESARLALRFTPDCAAVR